MTINTSDEIPIKLDNVVINETKSYTYLGETVSNNKIAEQVTNHMKRKKPQLRKFTSFLTKNSDCPYKVKHKVWNSAMSAAVFYSGSETWITSDLRAIESAYVGSIKQMLSVRMSTCNDLVFVYTGLTNAKSWVADRQY